MRPGLNSTPSERVAEALSGFLTGSTVRKLYIAEGSCAPAPLAFMVRFPRLSLTLQGTDEMEVEQNGSPCLLRSSANQAVFVPPNCWNRPTWRLPVKVLHFLFSKNHIGISLVMQDGEEPEPANIDKTSLSRTGAEPIQEIVLALQSLSGLPEPLPASRHLIMALLHRIHFLLQHPPADRGRRALFTYEKACLFIQQNFNRALTRQNVAEAFNLNPNHLSRLFRQEGLMRFVDYLTWVRVDRAKYLLKNHGMTLEEISSMCGFQESAYFCRVFKQRTNLTPSQYRQQATETSSK